MLSMTDPPKALVGVAAVLIAVVLGAGLVRVATFEETSDQEEQEDQAQEQAQQEESQQREAGQAQAEIDAADLRAFDVIVANLEACRNRYLPDARARRDQALAQLQEQRAAINRVIEELPPGRAKDSLIAQVGPDADSAIQLIEADYKAFETRCQLALTVYQYTHDSLPRPVP